MTISRSWRPRSYGGYTRGSTTSTTGTGCPSRGCAHALIDGRHTYESNKGVDVTRFNCISRHTIVQNCKTFGGGINSRGNNYGWNPDGSFLELSSPGSAITGQPITRHTGSTPSWMSGRLSVSEAVIPTSTTTSSWAEPQGGVVRAYLGTNLYVMNNRIIAGYWSLKPSNNFGGPHIDSMRRHHCYRVRHLAGEPTIGHPTSSAGRIRKRSRASDGNRAHAYAAPRGNVYRQQSGHIHGCKPSPHLLRAGQQLGRGPDDWCGVRVDHWPQRLQVTQRRRHRATVEHQYCRSKVLDYAIAT